MHCFAMQDVCRLPGLAASLCSVCACVLLAALEYSKLVYRCVLLTAVGLQHYSNWCLLHAIAHAVICRHTMLLYYGGACRTAAAGSRPRSGAKPEMSLPLSPHWPLALGVRHCHSVMGWIQPSRAWLWQLQMRPYRISHVCCLYQIWTVLCTLLQQTAQTASASSKQAHPFLHHQKHTPLPKARHPSQRPLMVVIESHDRMRLVTDCMLPVQLQ